MEKNFKKHRYGKNLLVAVIFICFALTTAACSGSKKDQILWLNGTYAVLTKVNDGYVELFGSFRHNEENRQGMLELLNSSWSITSREDLDETIDGLFNGGQNAMFLEELEEYEMPGMERDEFEEVLSYVEERLDVIYFRNMYDAYQDFGEKAILGWDLSRAVQLCAYGYIADFYTYEEAIQKALEGGKMIQGTFDSWDAFYDSYMYGYQYWTEDDTEDPDSSYNQRLGFIEELKADKESPLNLDWNLDLDVLKK